MTTSEMIEVLQAYERGEVIQYRLRGSTAWDDCNPYWDFIRNEYRVKPAPQAGSYFFPALLVAAV